MISVVIRNKNEGILLERTLKILKKLFINDISEIIIIDNLSTDNSKEVALKYGCKIVDIIDFTYGKAINLGIANASNNNVLLLSSHAMPVSSSFFKNTLSFIEKNKDWAGIRYVNSAANLERIIANNFEIHDPVRFGLMAACCLVSKKVWETNKFNEELPACEDKEWSLRITKKGLKIYDLNEPYYYDIKRTDKAEVKRFKVETFVMYKLNQELVSPSKLRVILSFIKKTTIVNFIKLLKTTKRDFDLLKAQFWISNQLK